MVKYDAVILGSGVLGLSIANELTLKGLKVAVVGKDLPEDLDSTGFASPWAGANWYSLAVNEAEQRRDQYTFEQFARLAKEVPHLCERRVYYYFWKGEDAWKEPWYKDVVFGYRMLKPEEVHAPFKYGVTYEAYTLNTPLYLLHLASTLRSVRVPILRARLSSLDEAYSLPQFGPVDLVINATGLGARSLLGVEDPTVFPAKGQTVLVRAPVKECYGLGDPLPQPGQKAYIIPRPGPDGHVILGGCYLPNDWSTNVDPDVAEEILKQCHTLCPRLDGKGGKGTWKDIEVIAHNVGLRPVREAGLRCEVEERVIGEKVKTGLATKGGKVGGGRKVGVVHAYGIGPAGYQASLGIAKEVSELVDGWMKKSSKKAKL
ncbi:hypothetical protein CNBE0250 [Cryptococcus deneoformans B-3501A]|uniref:D-amino-acid oxidase n=1 Tax=Cryptococcus deneoformans (strain JEC21 / ATCC MYA-565) TaxID=214684 RepID=Q5KHE7_CRYD1|nr:conserved hypothetical protein [Cryptococcus neoformans var. neoformans JEC21]XP_775306.1 hypothetical protein CNBE0250 [Cryptococcus neoformans var. neoformans B-3501A]AAW43426.1 conserved hypothetical protein [Cryptococcus neoformans var. neoformans JEC21]EAL20659.1 hypothetical protein CNBE0250 [Cryptococcus neoformans var. neoformans B-3501A]